MSALDAGLTRQAIKLYKAGKFREAEQLFRRLLRQDPDNWQSVLLLGLSRHSQGDFAEAEKWVRRSVALADGQPSTHYYLGRLMADKQQFAAAREQYAQAIALDPNHVEARTGMGLVSMMANNLERAVGEFKTALRADSDHVPALAALARALAGLERYDEAYPYASKALESEPDSSVSQGAMGRILFGQGQLDFAEKCFRNALQKHPDHGELNAQLAAVLKAGHRDQDALQHYSKALKQDFGGSSLVIDTSICLERIGDVPQARKLVRKAAERWPEDRAVALRQAELAMLDADQATAGQILAALDQQHSDVMMMQARLAEATGDSQRARDLLERLVDADTNGEHRTARLLLARIRSNVDPEDTASAREPIAEMLKRRPPVPDAVLVWSAICEKAGNFGEACESLELVLESAAVSDQEGRILHNRLANCYDQADNKALAWANWQKGAWRTAPHVPRLEAQRESGALDAWLAHDWSDQETRTFDDGLPSPVIVAGWPGSGREVLLAALGSHPQVTVLDRDGENRRLEALGLPSKPEWLLTADEVTLHLGRKRFMRGASHSSGHAGPPSVRLDAGWWEASAVPALAHYFPGATIVLPAANPSDLAVQWRVDGYADVDGMLDEYRKEMGLWRSMRDHLDLRVIEFRRGELLEDPEDAVDRLCRELGIEPAPRAREQATRVRRSERFIAEGSGARYHTATERSKDA